MLNKISGKECVKVLCNKFGFKILRQTGSHIILKKENGEKILLENPRMLFLK